MYSNSSNNEIVQKGRKKVYVCKEKLELTSANGDSDGVLDEGDLIYVVQKYKSDGKKAFRFMVMKFADTDKQSSIHSAEQEFFEPYFEKTENADGDSANATKDDKVKSDKVNGSTNYTVPALTALGGGALGYMIAQRFMKNKVMFTMGGLAIGLTVGIFLLKNKNKNK